MGKPKIILVVEDDEALGQSIEHGLHHLVGTEHGIPLRILRASEPIGAMKHIDSNHVDVVLLDVNLANGTNGIDFALELRKTYPYMKIIMLTEKSCDTYKAVIHEKIRYVRFFTKPINWKSLSGEVVFQLNAPAIPKKNFLPIIDSSSDTHRIPRKSFCFLRGIKGKKKIEIFTAGENPKIPDKEIVSILKHQSFEKFAAYMISPEEKELLRCERTTIINGDRVIRICKTEHYLILDGCAEKIWIDPEYRSKIYSLFRD